LPVPSDDRPGSDRGRPNAGGTLFSKRVMALIRPARAHYFQAGDELEPVGGDELTRRAADGAVVVVDVRPEHEYAAGHIEHAGSIPLDELDARVVAGES
jgi:predicted sulfurtransferase